MLSFVGSYKNIYFVLCTCSGLYQTTCDVLLYAFKNVICITDWTGCCCGTLLLERKCNETGPIDSSDD